MILSHRHQIIFLHCRKAAGSSLTVSLSRFLAPEDIQIGAMVDGATNGVYPPRRAIRNSLSKPCFHSIIKATARLSFWEYVNSCNKHYYRKIICPEPTFATAEELKVAFPSEWSRYKKVCVLRNPWDRTVSDYFWRARYLSAPPSFEDYVKGLYNKENLGGLIPKRHKSWDVFTIDGKVEVDKVVRYENLLDDVAAFLEETSINWDGWLPNSKQKRGVYRNRPSDYRHIYTDELAEMVHEIYKEEIVFGGYQFA